MKREDMAILARAKAGMPLRKWLFLGVLGGVMLFLFGLAAEIKAVAVFGLTSLVATPVGVEIACRRRSRRLERQMLDGRGESNEER